MSQHFSSLCETLFSNFTGDLALNQASEENQVILSVLDNMQRILNCRAGTLAHLPDYGLPDMTKILQGIPGTAHQAFNASVPVEEQIRQMSEREATETIPDAQKLQAKQHLQQLIIRYSALTNKKTNLVFCRQDQRFTPTAHQL